MAGVVAVGVLVEFKIGDVPGPAVAADGALLGAVFDEVLPSDLAGEFRGQFHDGNPVDVHRCHGGADSQLVRLHLQLSRRLRIEFQHGGEGAVAGIVLIKPVSGEGREGGAEGAVDDHVDRAAPFVGGDHHPGGGAGDPSGHGGIDQRAPEVGAGE